VTSGDLGRRRRFGPESQTPTPITKTQNPKPRTPNTRRRKTGRERRWRRWKRRRRRGAWLPSTRGQSP